MRNGAHNWARNPHLVSDIKKKHSVRLHVITHLNRTSSLCFIFFGPQYLWIVCCLDLKLEFRSCALGLQWCGIFYNH